jgi:uncharacterized protein (TIGR02246 family)
MRRTIVLTNSVIAVLSLAMSMLLLPAAIFGQRPSTELATGAHSLSEADKQAIQSIIKAQETAWNKHDMQAFTQSFLRDAESINSVGMHWRGKAAIRDHLSDYHTTFLKDVQEYVNETTIHAIDDRCAIAVSIWKVDGFKGPTGAEVPPSRFRGTLVLVKQPDGWKIAHFHNTTIDEVALKGAPALSKE